MLLEKKLFGYRTHTCIVFACFFLLAFEFHTSRLFSDDLNDENSKWMCTWQTNPSFVHKPFALGLTNGNPFVKHASKADSDHLKARFNAVAAKLQPYSDPWHFDERERLSKVGLKISASDNASLFVAGPIEEELASIYVEGMATVGALETGLAMLNSNIPFPWFSWNQQHFFASYLVHQAFETGVNLTYAYEVLSVLHTHPLAWRGSGIIHGGTWMTNYEMNQRGANAADVWAEVLRQWPVDLYQAKSNVPMSHIYGVPHGVGHGALITAVVNAFKLNSRYGPFHQLQMNMFPISEELLSQALETCDAAPSMEAAYICADGAFHAYMDLTSLEVDIQICSRTRYAMPCFRHLPMTGTWAAWLGKAHPDLLFLSRETCELFSDERTIRSCIFGLTEMVSYAHNTGLLEGHWLGQHNLVQNIPTCRPVELIQMHWKKQHLDEWIQKWGAEKPRHIAQQLCQTLIPRQQAGHNMSKVHFYRLLSCVHGCLFQVPAVTVAYLGVSPRTIDAYCAQFASPWPLQVLERSMLHDFCVRTLSQHTFKTNFVKADYFSAWVYEKELVLE